MSSRKTITYFLDSGEANTDKTLKLARERATELNITDIVVASTRGRTGVKTVEAFKGFNVVVVTHATGWREPGVQELGEEMAKRIEAGGGKILITGHAFSGVNTAIQKRFNTMYPAGIISQTLKLLGQGMSVCIQITAMAADAGKISADKDVIAISGSRMGADTAIVVKPANSHNLFDMVVKEIIAKPNKA